MLLELYNHSLLFLLDFQLPNWPKCLARSKQLSINVIFSKILQPQVTWCNITISFPFFPVIQDYNKFTTSSFSSFVQVKYISTSSGPYFLARDIEAARLKCVSHDLLWQKSTILDTLLALWVCNVYALSIQCSVLAQVPHIHLCGIIEYHRKTIGCWV